MLNEEKVDFKYISMYPPCVKVMYLVEKKTLKTTIKYQERDRK